MVSFDFIEDDDPEIIAGRYGSSYSDLKADHEDAVAAWHWASKIMYDPRPSGTLLEGGAGRWLRQKKKGTMPYEYGLGKSGETLVERIYMGHHYREQFFFHSEERVVSFSYPYDFKELAWVCVTRFADGRAVSHSRYSPLPQIGRLEERYEYTGGLLYRMHCHDIRDGRPWKWVISFSYDERGNLLQISSEHPAGTSVVYEKKDKG